LCAIEDLSKLAGAACVYCAKACTIYKERPQGCRDFNCAYVQMDNVNIALRPDKCGVVFEKINDTLVLGMVDPDREGYPHLRGQVEAFFNSGASIVLVKAGKPTVFNQAGVNPRDLIRTVNNIEVRHGNSSI
jgi:hypothetical protein